MIYPTSKVPEFPMHKLKDNNAYEVNHSDFFKTIGKLIEWDTERVFLSGNKLQMAGYLSSKKTNWCIGFTNDLTRNVKPILYLGHHNNGIFIFDDLKKIEDIADLKSFRAEVKDVVSDWPKSDELTPVYLKQERRGLSYTVTQKERDHLLMTLGRLTNSKNSGYNRFMTWNRIGQIEKNFDGNCTALELIAAFNDEVKRDPPLRQLAEHAVFWDHLMRPDKWKSKAKAS